MKTSTVGYSGFGEGQYACTWLRAAYREEDDMKCEECGSSETEAARRKRMDGVHLTCSGYNLTLSLDSNPCGEGLCYAL